MSFNIMHRDGRMDANPGGDWLGALLAELEMVDDEHPDIAVSHESEWTLSAFPSGLVVWENVESDPPDEVRVILTRSDLCAAMEALSRGDLGGVRSILKVA
jgi:hypothetical protein